MEKRQQQWIGRGLSWSSRVQHGREACEIEGLVASMEGWLGGCQWCRACEKEGSGHEMEDCAEEAEQARIGYALLRRIG